MGKTERATFAGGCFWCMVECFYLLEGVEGVVSGYSGGNLKNPTYKDVKSQKTGHYEVVRVTFDPTVTSYSELLDMYFRQVDPTDEKGQFQDRGDSYRTAIFYENEEQRVLAQRAINELQESKRFDKPIVTKILPLECFYPAEDYHQDFYKKSQKEYKEDRQKSGRDEFINRYWK